MAEISSILFSFSLLAGGLAAGYLFRVLYERGRIKAEVDIPGLRKRIQSAALIYLNPVALVGAIWIIDISDLRVLTLPLLGVVSMMVSGAVSLMGSRVLGLSRKQTGVFVTCGSLSNTGSVGSLMVYILLGEAGFALAPFFKLFEGIIFYSVGFPFAKSMSDSAEADEPVLQRVVSVLTDRFVAVSMLSLLLGLALNFSGLERPGFYSRLNSLLIPVSTSMMLSSIGMAMRFGRMRPYLREALAVASIKFFVTPASIYLLGSFMGLGLVDGGLPLKVSLILASMPVAFTALVPPTLYDLDVDMANTAWFLTTASLVLVIPALSILLGMI